MSSRHEGGQEVVMAVAAPHQMDRQGPSLRFNGIQYRLFTTFHRIPLCMSLGHEAAADKGEPNNRRRLLQHLHIHTSVVMGEDVPHLLLHSSGIFSSAATFDHHHHRIVSFVCCEWTTRMLR